MKSNQGTNLLLKAIRVLELVGSANVPPRLTDVVRYTGLPPGTAHRILDTLVSERLLRRDEATKAFLLGPRLLQLARSAWEDMDVRAAAEPELDRLHAALGQTVTLALVSDDGLVLIDKREAKDALRSSPPIGANLGLHCTAPGKAVLSSFDAARRQEAIRKLELNPVTPNTITDVETLKANVEIAAVRHFAVDDGESMIGVRGCAAPILDQRGQPVGALGYTGSTQTLALEECDEIGLQLAKAAENISWNLGFNPPERWTEFVVSRPSDAVEPLGSIKAFMGSDPHWSAPRQGVFWVDRMQPGVFFTKLDGSERRIMHSVPARGVLLSKTGLILVLPGGLHWLDIESGEVSQKGRPIAQPDERYVKARCDARGRLWITTMDQTLSRRSGKLYRVDPDLSSHCMADNMLFPLGIAWSPANDRIYFSDGPQRKIFTARFDLETGTLSDTKVFVTIPEDMGRPTGLAVDQEGFVWNTLSEGWRVIRIAPDGGIDKVIYLPIPSPVDCAFGGPHLKSLIITTARRGIPETRLPEVPMSGALLSFDCSVPGIAPWNCALSVD
ncbi:SMP-30/gluconolactonase/LRE family protein [Pseudochelatococcus sp. B33]